MRISINLDKTHDSDPYSIIASTVNSLLEKVLVFNP